MDAKNKKALELMRLSKFKTVKLKDLGISVKVKKPNGRDYFRGNITLPFISNVTLKDDKKQALTNDQLKKNVEYGEQLILNFTIEPKFEREGEGYILDDLSDNDFSTLVQTISAFSQERTEPLEFFRKQLESSNT